MKVHGCLLAANLYSEVTQPGGRACLLWMLLPLDNVKYVPNSSLHQHSAISFKKIVPFINLKIKKICGN